METSNLLPVPYYQTGAVEKNLQIAEMAYKSGLLPGHLRSPQAVLYVMQRGAALGLDPFFAAENTFLINGKLMLSVHAFQAILVKNGVRWEVKSNTSDKAEVVLTRESFGSVTSVFTADDARRAGLVNKDSYKAWPADVLYANAFRKGARKIAPDLLMGLSFLDDTELADKPGHEITVITPEVAQLEPAKKTPRKQKAEVIAEVQQPEAKPTFDNEDYHKCETIDLIANEDHRALVRSVADDLRLSRRWRAENREVIEKAMATCPPDTAAIKQVLECLYVDFPEAKQ